MGKQHRGKRAAAAPAATSEADTSSAATATRTRSVTRPSGLAGLSSPQFTSLVCTSLAITHIVDMYKTVLKNPNEEERMEFCTRYFLPQDNSTDVSSMQCTETDLVLLSIKCQTAILRIIMCLLTCIAAWGHEPVLKSWNITYGVFLVVQIGAMFFHQDVIQVKEAYTLMAVVVLIISSNRIDRSGRYKIDIGEGMHNLVLYAVTCGMSYFIASHMIFGLGEYTTLNMDDVSAGGEAVWFMTVVVDYSALMITAAFALFYFDEERKRAVLLTFGFVMLYHAFIQLPTQKEFWVDASFRQTCVMGIFAAFIVGAVVPSFNKFVVKK